MYDLANIIMTRDEVLLWKILKEDLPFIKHNSYGPSPMHAAAFHDEYIIGSWLEKRGCSLTSFDDLGNTPIHIAAAFANKQRTANFLGAILSPSLLCVRTNDEFGNTPLHFAGSWGNLKAVKILINAGVDPHIKDHYGLTVMHHAVFSRDQPRMIYELAMRGVPIHDLENGAGESALEFAVFNGFWGSAKTLIDMGAYSKNIDQKWLKFINPPNAVGWSSVIPARRPTLKIGGRDQLP
jgi:ankyrin repeat protein